MQPVKYRKAQKVKLTLAILATLSLLAACAKTDDKQAIDAYYKSIEDESLFENRINIYDENRTAHLPALTIPQSSAQSLESIAALKRGEKNMQQWQALIKQECPLSLSKATPEELPEVRRCRHRAFKKSAWYKDVMDRYQVSVVEETIGGIVTDIYTPAEGIDEKNRHRVLIHLHGGAHTRGNRWIGYLAATPIAAVGKVKVISVDYRQWPEATHPAAVVDSVAVYKKLLESYRPENIGLYDCSSGGWYVGQTIPWIQKGGLAKPGAIGVFGVGLGQTGSDSSFIGTAWAGLKVPTGEQLQYAMENPGQYFTGADSDDPLVVPGVSTTLLAEFPPTLFLTSTRDYNLSEAVYSHSQLVKLGVESDLHVWEGLGHCFIAHTNLPESHDAYQVITGFFDKQLGTLPKH